MKGISLFTGAGGFEIGFERAGIETVLQVEMDPWCQQVLQRHWPEVERIDDVCKVDPSALRGRRGDMVGVGVGPDAERLGGAPRGAAGTGERADGSLGEPASGDAPDGLRAPDHQRWREAVPGLSSGIDVIYGGFPCQDVSVAGKRAGLSGERSGLWFEFRRIVSELRPNWVVIENVPGLLSSHSGRDFTTILLGLEELGYGWAYRVLDARWFGVPQRRRRVFIVGCARGAARAAAVLAVCEGCGGHPAPRRQPQQDVAYALAASARGTGDGHGNAWNSTYIAPAFTVPSAHRGVGNGWNTNYVPEDAIAWDDRNQAADDVHHTLRGAGLQRSDVVLAATLSGGGHPGSNMPGRHKEDDQNLVVGNTLLKGGHSNNPLDDNLVVGSQIDAGQARPLVARASGYRMDLESENFIVADTLRTEYGQQSFRGDGADNLIAGAFYSTGGSHELHDDPTSSPAVNVGTGMGMPSPPAIAYGAGVRRLTPRECERLMGWPDDWTRWTADGQEIPDSHRYRLCGNGVVSVVAEWLGHRLVWMDAQ